MALTGVTSPAQPPPGPPLSCYISPPGLSAPAPVTPQQGQFPAPFSPAGLQADVPAWPRPVLVPSRLLIPRAGAAPSCPPPIPAALLLAGVLGPLPSSAAPTGSPHSSQLPGSHQPTLGADTVATRAQLFLFAVLRP